MRGSRASSGAFKPHLTPTPHCLNGLVRAVVCKRVLGNVCRHFPLSQLGVGGAMHPVGGGQGCLLHILHPQDRPHEKSSWKVRASSKRPPEIPGCSTYPLFGVSGVSLLPRSPAVLGVENHGKRPQMKTLLPSKGAWLVSLPWPQSLFACTLSPPCPQTFHFTEEPFMGHLPVERSGFWPECFPWTEDPN